MFLLSITYPTLIQEDKDIMELQIPEVNLRATKKNIGGQLLYFICILLRSLLTITGHFCCLLLVICSWFLVAHLGSGWRRLWPRGSADPRWWRSAMSNSGRPETRFFQPCLRVVSPLACDAHQSAFGAPAILLTKRRHGGSSTPSLSMAARKVFRIWHDTA